MQKTSKVLDHFYQAIFIILFSVSFLIAPTGADAVVPPGGTCYVDPGLRLYNGITHTAVLNLQKVLNNDSATQVASSGAGSPGQETSYFGPSTESAVQKFQKNYGIVSSGSPSTTGYGAVGPRTREKLVSIYGCTTAPIASVATSITVSAPSAISQVQTGSQYSIRWNTTGSTGKSFDIILLKGGSAVAGQRFTTNTFDLNGDGLVNQQDINFNNNLFATDAQCPVDKKGCDMARDGSTVSSSDVGRFINYINYDLNGDGNVSQQDVDLLNQVVAGGISCPSGKTCDLDRSGFYNDSADTVIMISFIGSNGVSGTIDYNNDSKIDQADLIFFRDLFTRTLPCPPGKMCDTNQDGTSGDSSDVVTLTNYIGGSGVYGKLDFNNDGKLDQTDVQTMINIFAQEAPCPTGKFCDLDGSEKNTAAGNDVTVLMNFIASLNAQNFVWNWSVSATLALGNDYKVRIEDISNRSLFNESGLFSVIAPPTASLTLNIDETLPIPYNSPATLRWTSSKAASCTASDGWSGVKPRNGSQSIGPLTSNTTFTLFCPSLFGDVTQSVIVAVSPPPPTSVVLSTNGALLIPYNSSATIVWSPQNATSCTASGGAGAWAGAKAVTGGSQMIGPLTSNTTFTMSCSGIANTDTQSITISVEPPPPISAALSINNVLPIPYNSNVNIVWAPQNATSCAASGGAGAWAGAKLASGGSQTIASLTSDTTFTLSCSGPAGTDTKSVTVTVEPPPAVVISFSAIPSTVSFGNAANLSWSAPNATSCTASGNWSGAKGISGNQSTGLLSEDRKYTLTCVGPAGTAAKDIAVSVVPTISVTVPVAGSQLEQGKSYRVTWVTTGSPGDDFEINLLRNGAAVIGQKFSVSTRAPSFDLTGDGVINQQDISFIQNLFSQDDSPCPADKKGCDISGDGPIVSAGDIVMFTNFVAYDLNSDNRVDQQDVDFLNQVVAGNASCPTGKVCDIDRGGQVSGNDVLELLNFIASITFKGFVWTVPTTLTPGSGYAFRVEAVSNRTVQGQTPGTFSVVPAAKIEVSLPNGGEIWTIGSITAPKNITWKSTGLAGASVDITLMRQPGDIVMGLLTPAGGIVNNQGNFIAPQNNTFAWKLDEAWLTAGSGYTIKICSREIPTLCDESNASFSILDEVPNIDYTEMILTPPSPYTIGETLVSYDSRLTNKGIRALYGLTLAAWVEQGGAKSNEIELPLACRTQLPGVMSPGFCKSDSPNQNFRITNSIGQFVQGPGKFVTEIRLGGAPLTTPARPAKKEVSIYLYPAPGITLIAPNGPATIDKFPLGRQTPEAPILIKWRTQGLIDNVVIKLKQVNPSLIYDFNNDGIVNQNDSEVLRSYFSRADEMTSCRTETGKNCDIDGDGELMSNDIAWFLSNVLSDGPLRYVDRVEMYDFNGDGVVDQLDVNVLQSFFAVDDNINRCRIATGKNCDLDADGGLFGSDTTLLINNVINKPQDVAIIPGASNIANNKEQENTFRWTPEAPFVFPAGNYKIVICDIARPNVCAESRNTFLIFAGPPTFSSPAVNAPYDIKEDMSIRVMVSHALGLTRYKLSLYQNNELLYENMRDAGLASTMPFIIDKTLVRASDGKRIIDLLRDGKLRIMVSGELGSGKGYTNSANREVALKFNRRAPTIVKPGDRQEISLGKSKITITATHDSNPTSYKVRLYQNSVLLYSNDDVLGDTNGMSLDIDRDAEYLGRNVFQSLDRGEVLLVVQGKLLDGYTDEARRIFTVVPLPPDYDLNDDRFVTSADLAILQATIVYDAQLRKAVDEGRATTSVKVPPLIEPCINLARAKPKNCNYYPDFEKSSTKRSKGMRIIDSRDATLLISSDAYDTTKTVAPPTVSSTGAPTVTSPASNAVWVAGSPQNVVIQTVSGATGYLVGFIRGSVMIFENYRDDNRNICTTGSASPCVSAGSSQTYSVPAQFKDKFTAGPVNIYVRALVNNQWTEATVVPIVINNSGSSATPQTNILPPQGTFF